MGEKKPFNEGKQAVRVIIYNPETDKYFISNRPDWSTLEPSTLALIGGSVETDEEGNLIETHYDAIRREIGEELVFQDPILEYVLQEIAWYAGNGWVSAVYIMHYTGEIDVVDEEKKEGVAGEWRSIAEMQEFNAGVGFQHGAMINDHRSERVLHPVSVAFLQQMPELFRTEGIKYLIPENLQ